eukprot:COSAG02_NODE_1350_length_13120_cov_4.275555_9_plen_71_part_00
MMHVSFSVATGMQLLDVEPFPALPIQTQLPFFVSSAAAPSVTFDLGNWQGPVVHRVPSRSSLALPAHPSD